MSMFRKVLLTIGLILAANVAVFAQGTLRGTVKDALTGEPVVGATVQAKQNGQMVNGAATDFDGMYTINGLPVGKYDIEVSYMGYTTVNRTEVQVKASDFTMQNFVIKQTSEVLEEVVIETNKVPIIEVGTAATGKRLTGDDIQKMPVTSVESILAQVGGVCYSDGGTATARGEENMVTQVGGVRVRTGVNVPKEAIAEIQVILGGTLARIGEDIGGTQIVNAETASNQFNGMVRWRAISTIVSTKASWLISRVPSWCVISLSRAAACATSRPSASVLRARPPIPISATIVRVTRDIKW